MLMGVDLSVWNKDIPFTFGQFQIHKITENDDIIDMRFAQWWDNRKNGDMLNGIYHFVGMSNPRLQAEHLLNVMKAYKVTDVIICFDFEGEAYASDENGVRLKGIIETLQESISFQSVVYADISTLETLAITGYNAEWYNENVSWWIADWSTQNVEVSYYGRITPVIRQFTSHPICDCDAFFGSEGGFKSLCWKGGFIK